MEIPGYNLIEIIGQGGMSVVWRARQESLDRDVAIKILRQEYTSNQDEIGAFVTEAKVVAQLKHQHIIQVYDVGTFNNTCYIIMEFIDGPTVFDMIRTNNSIPWKRAMNICQAVAEALENAWQTSNTIHCDIKPGNIMVHNDGVIKLGDFGLSKLINTSHQNDSGDMYIEGTPNYLSPEQAQGSVALDIRSDMYSLGASLYYMITGVLPFSEFDEDSIIEKQITGQLKNPREINKSIPLGVVQFLTRLMMKDPQKRYSDWGAVLKDLKKAAAGRLIAVGKTNPNASTIAPIRSAKSTPRLNKNLAPATNEQSVPMFIQIPAWLLLITFWIFLGYVRSRPPKITTHISRATTSTSHANHQKQARQHITHIKVAKTTPTPSEDALETQAKELDKIMESGNSEESETTGSRPISDMDRQKIVAYEQTLIPVLIQGNYAKASAMLSNELEYSHSQAFEEELYTIKDFIDILPDPIKKAEEGFKKRTFKKVDLVYNGKQYRVIILEVNNGQVKVRLVVDNAKPGTKQPEINFKIANLSPEEIRRWAGAPETPGDYFLQFALLARVRDFSNAEKYANKSGPLKGACQDYIKRYR